MSGLPERASPMVIGAGIVSNSRAYHLARLAAAKLWGIESVLISPTHIAARTSEGLNKTYGIVHPMEQWASNRNVRLSPVNVRQLELGAEFFGAAGWQRPSGMRAGGRRSSTPSTSRCATGWAWSTLPRSRSSTSPGPPPWTASRASPWARWTCTVGRTVYTTLLNEAGGIFADLTIIRLGHDHYRVATGGGLGSATRRGSPNISRPTARPRSRTSPRPSTRSGSGGRGRATSCSR